MAHFLATPSAALYLSPNLSSELLGFLVGVLLLR